MVWCTFSVFVSLSRKNGAQKWNGAQKVLMYLPQKNGAQKWNGARKWCWCISLRNALNVGSSLFFCFPKRLKVQMHFIWRQLRGLDILVKWLSFTSPLNLSWISFV